MKKFAWSALIFIVLVLLITVGHAEAVPDIRGEYSGSYTIVVSNCSDSSMNGTYNAILAITIPTQTGNIFSGSATGTVYIDGLTGTEYIQLSGTITESGQISGNTSHNFFGTGGVGTFTGQLSGNTLSIENSGHDTYGDVCSYTRSMSATRIPPPPPTAIFSVDPTSGIEPLSVNFTDESTGSITSWNWNFGDGTSSTLQHPSHTYIHEGNYTVSLTVSGPDGSDTEIITDYLSVEGSSNSNKLKILPSDGAAGYWFGSSVSISGNYAIVGVPADDENGSQSGSAYIFERSGSSWNQVDKLTASDGAEGDVFGWSVSISGDFAIVGAYRDGDKGVWSGSAYIFERSDSSWNQVDKLTASDGASSDWFGYSVSISGDYAIVSAIQDDDNGSASGSAYIFERSGSSWNQVDKLNASDGAAGDFFGWSVSISGDYAIVGAMQDDDNGKSSGSAYIFERSGSSWIQVDKLIAGDGAEWDNFGWSVSISGDYAMAGAKRGDGNDQDSGSAYIFERSGSSWNEVDKLIAGDGADGDLFGSSVSISGDYAIVNAESDGSAYIFKRSGSSWNQVDKLTVSYGYDANYTGRRVSISGYYAIVGAYSDDDNGGNSGAAYIFEIPTLKHSSDTNQDWIIGDFELLDAIDQWAAANLGDFELLDLIDYWAAGCYQWDAVVGSYKAGCN